MNHTSTFANTYIGRFAPSPSGPLHFGSLVTALASYLDAKHHHGQWLVRMEDIDPPREIKGAQDRILSSLLAHGLQWDGEVMRQSTRLHRYEQTLQQLHAHTYACFCNRQRLASLHGIYDSHCDSNSNREHSPTAKHSVRLRINAFSSNPNHPSSNTQQERIERFTDIFQGPQEQPLQSDSGDFILRRKDGLYAYQLAVVVDDIAQGITHIIRGSDLLPTSSRQRYLWALLHQINPTIPNTIVEYGHVPVAATTNGQKLSKQNNAAAINDDAAFDNICRALTFLCHTPPSHLANKKNLAQLLLWATEHWHREHVPKVTSIVVDE